MLLQKRPIRIGLSARIFHPEPGASGIKSKTLLVLEQSVAKWAMTRDVLLLMVPSVMQDGALMRSNIRLRDYARYLDGLILQGGADVSPKAYGEEPVKPEWIGDPVRDTYELELVHEFMEEGKPILGICRGMQLLNVALGGSLYQDLRAQFKDTANHEGGDYDLHTHEVVFEPGCKMASWFGDLKGGKVVSIHHQGIKQIGRGVLIEARAKDDGLIEAIRWKGPSFVCGVQWHPEFHHHNPDTSLLDCAPVLEAFLDAAKPSWSKKMDQLSSLWHRGGLN